MTTYLIGGNKTITGKELSEITNSKIRNFLKGLFRIRKRRRKK